MSIMRSTQFFLFVVVLSTVACSSQAPGTEPDDMSIEEHRQEARKHEKMSEEHRDQYDPGAVGVRHDAPGAAFSDVYTTEVYNPTKHHSQTAQKHERHADQHEDAAEQLLSYEERHCVKFPEETRSTCPLMGQIKAVEDVEGGVRITFREGVPMQPTLDHMKCHFAFARTQGYQGMQSCPLYVRGVSFESEEASDSIRLTTDNPEAVESLRRRTREHVD